MEQKHTWGWPIATYLFLGGVGGGLILRFLVVYTSERKMLPGEERFFALLPRKDEAFLHAWSERRT